MAYNEKHLVKLADLKALGPSRKRSPMLWRRVLILWRMLALRPTSLRVSR